MSSRILKQDSGLILTQASEPLVNENFAATDAIQTGQPTVSATDISQVHFVLANSIETSPAVTQTSAVTQTHNISVVAVLAGQVVISSSGLTQGHDLPSSDTFSGNPIVSSSGLTQGHDLPSSDTFSGNPIVSSSGLTQGHDLQAEIITTGNPTVPSVVATENENFSVSPLITDVPDVGSSSFTQVYNLAPVNILTPRPNVGKAVDPDAIIAQEIKEIEQMFGGWQRRTYEVPDGKMVQAEREIQNIFGDVVSIDKKAKSLIKFGKSAPLSANGTSTVWTVGGHETYVTDNLITHISSSSASDVYEVFLECHTITGTGYDEKFTFLTQTVTLQGQTKVALPFAVARVSQINNNNGVELVGRVTVYEDTTVVGGVPSDPTKIHIDIPAGLQSSFKAATTLSDEDYYVLTGGFGSVSLKQAAAADFYLEVRLAGKVFVQKAAVSGASGGPWNIELDPAVIIPRNADIRITVETDTNNAVVFGVFKGYLAKVIG